MSMLVPYYVAGGFWTEIPERPRAPQSMHLLLIEIERLEHVPFIEIESIERPHRQPLTIEIERRIERD